MTNEEQKQGTGANKPSDEGEPAKSTFYALVALAVIGCAVAFGVTRCNNFCYKDAHKESIFEGTFKEYSVRRDVDFYNLKKRVIIYNAQNRQINLIGIGRHLEGYDIRQDKLVISYSRWDNIDLSNVPKGNSLEKLANVSDLEGAWNSATNKPVARGFWEEEK